MTCAITRMPGFAERHFATFDQEILQRMFSIEDEKTSARRFGADGSRATWPFVEAFRLCAVGVVAR